MTDNIVAIAKCSDYAQTAVSSSLNEVIKPLGGWDAFVKSGMTILLKPNMLSCKHPDAAATTHPSILAVVAQECIKRGARVIIGDSPPLALKRIEEYWEKTGFREVADKTGASLAAFERLPSREISLEVNGNAVKVHVTSLAFESDLIISLSKMKTHNLTLITGAVKNLYGLLPGMQKPRLHIDFPHPGQFSELIAKIASSIPAHLSIMDAIEAMDGQGPSGGRVVKPGLLLASKHPVALDLAYCLLIDLAPEKVPFLKHCKALSFGPGCPEDLEFPVLHPDEARIDGFRIPRTTLISTIPDIFVRIGRRLIHARPVVNENVCVSCGACARICPAKAISIIGRSGNKSNDLKFNYKRCISCFCCMEVCSVDAISMKAGPMLEIVLAMKNLKKKFLK